MAHVMVLDDEPSICWAFRNFLGDEGHRVSIASTAEQAIAHVRSDPPEVLFLDVRLPGMDGLTALDHIRDLSPATSVIVMTAHGTVQTAVRAVRAGAFDYLTKPFDLDQARLLVRRALHVGGPAIDPDARVEDSSAGDALIGRSAPMQRIFKQVALAASCSAPVLITGESGTGKELVARAIHQHGDRAAEPFVAVHLAALPETLVERELFGHERAAFTGAEGPQEGLMDRAGAGTLFLDEVAEAPPAIQVKLLRVLDGGDYRSIGGGDRRLRARVVAATNRDLEAGVRSGSFRADLFYRLAVVSIHLPPLRQRPDDIPLLWDRFLDRIAPGAFSHLDPYSPLGMSLTRHHWPGNVRELRNAAEHAARSGHGPTIYADHLPPNILAAASDDPKVSSDLETAVARWLDDRSELAAEVGSPLYDAFLRVVEGPLLRAVLVRCRGNRAQMARLLGMHRTTLRNKLQAHRLDPGMGDSSA